MTWFFPYNWHSLVFHRERESHMATTVDIERRTFERLQEHAKPFVDTPDAVINRALDALDRATPHAEPDLEPQTASSDWISLDANDPLPDLRHTRILAAAVDGNRVKANWNNVLRQVLVLALEVVGGLDELRCRCAVNLVSGVKEDEGYRYVAEADFSFQGVNANAAANAVVALAKDVGLTLELDFEWRPKPQAAYPGRRARLLVSG